MFLMGKIFNDGINIKCNVKKKEKRMLNHDAELGRNKSGWGGGGGGGRYGRKKRETKEIENKREELSTSYLNTITT